MSCRAETITRRAPGAGSYRTRSPASGTASDASSDVYAAPPSIQRTGPKRCRAENSFVAKMRWGGGLARAPGAPGAGAPRPEGSPAPRRRKGHSERMLCSSSKPELKGESAGPGSEPEQARRVSSQDLRLVGLRQIEAPDHLE